MAEIIRLKKGLDINMYGKADEHVSRDTKTRMYAVCPDDFPGYKWKLAVLAGDPVAVGTPLLYAKENEQLKLVSPVSGRVADVRRGERRKILAVIVEKDEQVKAEAPDLTSGTLEDRLQRSGLWAMMRQRPYDIIPRAGVSPRDIFITAFDSAPLAKMVIMPEHLPLLEEGIKALSTLTSGTVYLGVKFGSGISSATAEVIEFQGPHPAGNVGVQIANIKPVNKGETVWTLDARTVARIGALVTGNMIDTEAEVVLCGEVVDNPHVVVTNIGAKMETLLEGMLKKHEDFRVISGNVLTGIKEDPDTGFLRWPYRQVSVIDEGENADEFMGWASINPKRYSVSRAFPAFLRGLSKPFHFDSRLKGGHRAMIVSGEYDKVFPMDIYPEYLLRAIMAGDIDKMEQLGIYEVAPEDFALPEFVDTSKQPLQQIVRDGLDKLRQELGE